MKKPSLELKVALLGSVSAGKSTVLNALLNGKYSEVAMRRTTAGVNLFRLHSDNEAESWGSELVAVHSTDYILDKITRDNATLRESNMTQESTFDVQVKKPLCITRPDTKLVLMDIPGLDEADSQDMYRDYVRDRWKTFDAVIVVVDIVRAVNTDEQVQILELVQRNLKEKRHVPVIVVCNKVDDPNDSEIQALLTEVQAKVNETFTDSDSLQVVAVSAKKAFQSCTDGQVSWDDFQRHDIAKYDRIGREEVGKVAWQKCTLEEKYQIAYQALQSNDDDDNKEINNRDDNFAALLTALECSIGGDEKQTNLLGQQYHATLDTLSLETGIFDVLQKTNRLHEYLGVKKIGIETYFWDAYQTALQASIEKYTNDMVLCGLSKCMQELIQYDTFLCATNFHAHAEREKIASETKGLIKALLNILMQKVKSVDRAKGGFLFPNPPLRKYVFDVAKGVTVAAVTVASPEVVVAGVLLVPGAWKTVKSVVESARDSASKLMFQTDSRNTDRSGKRCGQHSWDDLTPLDMYLVCSSILESVKNVLTESTMGIFDEQLAPLNDVIVRYGTYKELEAKVGRVPNAVRYEDIGDGNYVRVDSNVIHVTHLTSSDDPTDSVHWGHLLWQFYQHFPTQSSEIYRR